MTKEILEARFNGSKKHEAITLLKEEGQFVQFSEGLGYIYDLIQPIARGCIRIRLSLKSGRILVHNLQEISL